MNALVPKPDTPPYWAISPDGHGGFPHVGLHAAGPAFRHDIRRPAETLPEIAMNRRRSVLVRLSAIALGMLASGLALADARIDPKLAAQMADAAATDELQVVVSFRQSTPVSTSQRLAMASLGITRGITMRKLPIAGALATKAEIAALAKRSDVASIYWNAPIEYYNLESRQISGAKRTTDNPGHFNRAIPFSGAGVSVVVNDSGIDGTHDDLKFGNHVVQNTLGTTNLHAVDAMLPITYTEGVPNTDLGSGHGTHCAGTIGGTGARSGGLYRGVAPGAKLVGYGSGAVIFVLDAVGGLDYAALNQFSYGAPIRVVSNSWGSSGDFDPLDPVSISTYELYKRGIVSVFAAGNDGAGEDTHNPYAQAPWVISVAAGEKDGVLTSFSSRGKFGQTGTFQTLDGKTWRYWNEPTITATGVDVVSTRTLTGVLPPLAADYDAEFLAPEHLPFYTHMSGTSMATPHVSGIIALMLEANPDLTPAQVKDILERTATNMTARASWEVGAGHVNAYAAVAEAAGLRSDWGGTVNSLNTYNANALLKAGPSQDFSIDFAPVGTVENHVFEVTADTALVTATANVGDNTVALVLIDPDGVQYGSAISLPEIGARISTSAPGKAGTWKLTVRGIGFVSGNDVDPANVTNGYGAPGTVSGKLSFLISNGYSGLADISTHPAKQAIQFAVANRLMDGHADGRFRPEGILKRIEMAQYLVMGGNVRQSLPLNGTPSFNDVLTGTDAYYWAEAAAAKGGSLRDLAFTSGPVMGLTSGKFLPTAQVTRQSAAYSLVQAMGLEKQAKAFTGPVTAFYLGARIPVEDAATIHPALRGYVQYALDVGLLNAKFTLTQGPYDLQPVVHAWFEPTKGVTRAQFAVAMGRYQAAYREAEDD
jgi:serine protease AprX